MTASTKQSILKSFHVAYMNRGHGHYYGLATIVIDGYEISIATETWWETPERAMADLKDRILLAAINFDAKPPQQQQ